MSYDWSPPVEELIKRIGEQAECYSILHKRAERYYAYFNHFIAIPVIVLSTVSGSGNFIFGGDKEASLVVGAISILTGVISTLGTYFRFAQLAEGNRISGIQYNKLYQRISAELALTREHRIDANQLLTDIRETVERLEEVSPAIPTAVIDSFKRDYKQYHDVSRPNIANGLDTIKINVQQPELPRSPIPSLSSPLPPLEEEKKPESSKKASWK
jgi:hypothetical protein